MTKVKATEEGQKQMQFGTSLLQPYDPVNLEPVHNLLR
jgi:hypothetical protein